MSTETDAAAAAPKRSGRRAGTPELVADVPVEATAAEVVAEQPAGSTTRRTGRRAGAAPSVAAPVDAEAAPIEDAADPSKAAAETRKSKGRRVGATAVDDQPSSPRSAAGRRARAGAESAPADVVAASTIAAPRPYSQRAGRRASETFADETTRSSAGRRAKAAADAASTPVVETTPAAPITDVVIEVEPVAASEHDTVDVTAEVEAVSAPVVTKPVSRRTLRTAPVADAASDKPSSPDASRTTSDASETTSAASHTSPDAPRSTPDTPRSASTGRRSRRGDIAKGAFSVVAMLFAAGIAVATTMPASAFHAATAATGVSAPSVAGDLAAALPGQELTTGSQTLASDITRDGYGVRDIAALRAAGYRIADTFTNNPNGTIQWPFPVGVPISDGFGPRESPGGIGSTDHKGVDFTPGQGTTIQSIADGVVRLVQASDNGGLGVYVIIDHVIDGQAVSSVYGHMLTGSVEVTEGQVVKVAQAVGKVGNTGTSTGAHLHFEVRLDGVTPVDPFAWLQANAN
ncbi:peptidoglycan DD-metalloendopeptidase family protein [Herbiconiux sp. A18JL235]|uniref:Peptidoglycan DD-metalloendopeptidase family protein n=1 Tax=Herbiconiux sp. A18JL235 TaxID=3152363 RepID=A0AB39BHS8_9MICO